jgi:hypothetical protein
MHRECLCQHRHEVVVSRLVVVVVDKALPEVVRLLRVSRACSFFSLPSLPSIQFCGLSQYIRDCGKSRRNRLNKCAGRCNSCGDQGWRQQVTLYKQETTDAEPEPKLDPASLPPQRTMTIERSERRAKRKETMMLDTGAQARVEVDAGIRAKRLAARSKPRSD